MSSRWNVPALLDRYHQFSDKCTFQYRNNLQVKFESIGDSLCTLLAVLEIRWTTTKEGKCFVVFNIFLAISI